MRVLIGEVSSEIWYVTLERPEGQWADWSILKDFFNWLKENDYPVYRWEAKFGIYHFHLVMPPDEQRKAIAHIKLVWG